MTRWWKVSSQTCPHLCRGPGVALCPACPVVTSWVGQAPACQGPGRGCRGLEGHRGEERVDGAGPGAPVSPAGEMLLFWEEVASCWPGPGL